MWQSVFSIPGLLQHVFLDKLIRRNILLGRYQNHVQDFYSKNYPDFGFDISTHIKKG